MTTPMGHIGSVDNRILIGVIADEETVIGFLLAGIGEHLQKPVKENFMIVSAGTPINEVEQFFLTLYQRRNIGVILLGAEVMKLLGNVLPRATRTLPILLVIPKKNILTTSTSH